MKVRLHKFDLLLKNKFAISRMSFDIKPSLIVELETDGYSGFGEATENTYYNLTIPIIEEHILKIKDLIESTNFESPKEFSEFLEIHLSHDRFAMCALDNAFWDLFAQKRQQKLYQFFNFDTIKNPLTNYTIGIDSIENMVKKLNEKPWPIYKIKLGTNEDVKIVKELRKHTNSLFRVDANCGWKVDQTIKNANEFKNLNVEFIEQPLKADDWEGHQFVYQNSSLPIIADESCIVEEDIEKCFNHFHGVNVKLMKCGGISVGLRMLHNAKKLGLKTMVGCMIESSIGISSIAHLLPILNYVDMDGAMLLKEDIAQGVLIENGKVLYSNLNGIGARLK